MKELAASDGEFSEEMFDLVTSEILLTKEMNVSFNSELFSIDQLGILEGLKAGVVAILRFISIFENNIFLDYIKELPNEISKLLHSLMKKDHDRAVLSVDKFISKVGEFDSFKIIPDDFDVEELRKTFPKIDVFPIPRDCYAEFIDELRRAVVKLQYCILYECNQGRDVYLNAYQKLIDAADLINEATTDMVVDCIKYAKIVIDTDERARNNALTSIEEYYHRYRKKICMFANERCINDKDSETNELCSFIDILPGYYDPLPLNLSSFVKNKARYLLLRATDFQNLNDYLMRLGFSIPAANETIIWELLKRITQVNAKEFVEIVFGYYWSGRSINVAVSSVTIKYLQVLVRESHWGKLEVFLKKENLNK